MKIFAKYLYQDGGPARGELVEFKGVLKNEPVPKNKNGFEQWREISLDKYVKMKKEAKKKFRTLKI